MVTLRWWLFLAVFDTQLEIIPIILADLVYVFFVLPVYWMSFKTVFNIKSMNGFTETLFLLLRCRCLFIYLFKTSRRNKNWQQKKEILFIRIIVFFFKKRGVTGVKILSKWKLISTDHRFFVIEFKVYGRHKLVYKIYWVFLCLLLFLYMDIVRSYSQNTKNTGINFIFIFVFNIIRL